jgi:putative Holliday junction resolvase
MGRILGIDYGMKRTGLAVTDDLKIIASPLETVPTDTLLDWLKNYSKSESVETIVVGNPINLDQSPTHSTASVEKLLTDLHETFPGVRIEREDERFTSKMAKQAMIAGGMKKKERRKKSNVDKISAAIILLSYMERQ